MIHTEQKAAGKHQHGHSYLSLLYMVLLSFVAMYILMYAMVDTLANVIPNVNQFYMAGLMTAPMVPIEIILMRKMYNNLRRNISVCLVAILGGAACFYAIRMQTCVGDKQFLKSMVPHHGAAVLMVKEAELSDPEVQALAREIITAQEKEIDQMKAMIEKFEDDGK